nr:replication-associated protein [Youcai mosaic virus]
MAQFQQTVNMQTLQAAAGRNSLVNDLASRRVYDNAVEELNARSRRPKVHFSKSVSTEQTLLASNAYPEFEISFTHTQHAVHSLAGGLRTLELEYLMMQVPFGSLTYDIGGNFAAHLFKGRDYVHCCMPNLDVRDIARHEGHKEAIFSYLSRLDRQKRPVPEYQRAAFNNYAENPHFVHCDRPFQQCELSTVNGADTYAIALHSIYDIPADEFGAALLRKNVKICYAAFHFHENMLLDCDSVTLEDIGATFQRAGDKLNFFFHNESTLNYTHSFCNIIKYVCKTFFPASQRYVYHKEFLVTRVNTWYCKFTRVDTFTLFRGVYRTSVDSEEFYKAMDDAWEYKKTLAMLNSERTIFKDSAAMNFWFPKVRDMVIIPLFDASITTGRMSRREVLVNKDFVYTVLNHIKTYQAKALTYANVLSFVESIRSRVIINGVTARSEWDTDKAILGPLAMTFFLVTKLSHVQDEIVLKKFQKFDATAKELIWSSLCDALKGVFPSVKETLARGGFVKLAEESLEIKIPELYCTFSDRLVLEYKRTEEFQSCDLSKPLEESEKYYNALSELSVLENLDSFDLDAFKELCQKKNVDPDVAAKVVVAIMNSELTLPFKKPTEEEVAEALSGEVVQEEGLSLSNNASFPCVSNLKEGLVPACGLCPKGANFDRVDMDISEFHLKSVDAVKKGAMMSAVYTGKIKVQQMKNYVDYLSASLSATVSNLCKVLRDVHGVDPESQEKSGVWDVRRGRWLLKPNAKCHAWGVAEDANHKLVIVLLNWDEGKPVCDQTWFRLAVSSDSLVYSDMGKLKTLTSCCRDGEPPEPTAKVVLVDGVPGCGKTKEILEKVNFSEDLVLVPGKEASKMIIRRANQAGVTRADKDNVRTVDSFLMHPPKRVFKRLFIDEGLMLHTGCVNFLTLLSQCDVAYVYGDTQQIPFICRVANFPYPSHFAKLVVDEKEDRRVTLRCPADVTHFLNTRYDGPVTCTSSVERSVSAEVVRGKGALNPITLPLEGKILTFTQADKFELLDKGYKEVNTVHEVQGETYEKTAIVRLTATPLEIISRASPHVLVALTRHTTRCKYYTVVLDPMVNVISELGKLSNFLLEMYKVESGTQ